MKIIHTADWHLSSSLSAGTVAVQRAVRTAQEQFLANLVALVKKEQVHILLLAGDIFDTPEPEAFWLQLLQNVLADIKNTRVFITPGNHDPYLDDGIWTDPGWSSNVHIFKPQAERVLMQYENFKVSIDGQAFERFLAPEVLFNSLAFSEDEEDAYRILLLHGDVTGEGISSHYNPIRLADARYQPYHYLALGHVHKAQQFSLMDNKGFAVYPGSPQGRGFDENGRPKLMLGSLTTEENGRIIADWQPRSLAKMLFLTLNVDISSCQNMAQIIEQSWKSMQAFPALSSEEMERACWRIVLTGSKKFETAIALDYVVQQLGHKGAFYVRLYDQSFPELSVEALKEQGGFAGIIYKNFENERKRIKKQDMDVAQLEKSLYYALAAHENYLSLEQVVQSLDAYHEYRAEVQSE